MNDPGAARPLTPTGPFQLLSNPKQSNRSARYYQRPMRSIFYQGGGNARRCHMLTLCKSTVLDAAFLAEVAIAANADRATTSAAGTSPTPPAVPLPQAPG